MSRKRNSLINKLVEETKISGPAPDEGLTTIGLDMFWVPPNHEPVKKEVKIEEDPMLSIL